MLPLSVHVSSSLKKKRSIYSSPSNKFRRETLTNVVRKRSKWYCANSACFFGVISSSLILFGHSETSSWRRGETKLLERVRTNLMVSTSIHYLIHAITPASPFEKNLYVSSEVQKNKSDAMNNFSLVAHSSAFTTKNFASIYCKATHIFHLVNYPLPLISSLSVGLFSLCQRQIDH